jgi:hypothetical protein
MMGGIRHCVLRNDRLAVARGGISYRVWEGGRLEFARKSFSRPTMPLARDVFLTRYALDGRCRFIGAIFETSLAASM